MDPDGEVPTLSDTIDGLINNNTYTGNWSKEKETQFQSLFKLERVAKTKDDENLYKDR